MLGFHRQGHKLRTWQVSASEMNNINIKLKCEPKKSILYVLPNIDCICFTSHIINFKNTPTEHIMPSYGQFQHHCTADSSSLCLHPVPSRLRNEWITWSWCLNNWTYAWIADECLSSTNALLSSRCWSEGVDVCVRERPGFWGILGDITFSSVWLMSRDVQPRVEYHYTLSTIVHNSHTNRHTAAAFIC